MAERSVEFFDDRDDADLLALARSGDARCADVLWIRLRPSVLAVARSITGNRHDAEDLASEAMTKVFAAIADGQGPTESVLPYLYATVRNLHLSALRRQARVGTPVELHEQRVLNLVTSEPDVIESDLVSRAFTSLPDRWRYVLWASLVEGRPGNEIADQLGIKPSAVHALKSRALEGLRQQYLSEHARLSEEQECAQVHRVLASIARGRVRRSTDLNQVWRHLRGCEHCAEGYQEITAINNRIGLILGPAAATLVGFAPHATGAATVGVLQLPAAAGKIVAAAGVAGAIAITGTTLTHHPDRAEVAPRTVLESPAATAAPATPAAARPRPAVQKPRAAAGTAAVPATPAAPCTAPPTERAVAGDLTAALPSTLAPRTSAQAASRCTTPQAPTVRPQAPAPAITGLDPARTLDHVDAMLDVLPTPGPTVGPTLGSAVLPAGPAVGLLQP